MKQYPTPEMSLKAVEKLLASITLNQRGRLALLERYVDLNRQLRKLRIAQWETARSLIPDWHGTPEELVRAAKELS